jgi:hypothetical protein
MSVGVKRKGKGHPKHMVNKMAPPVRMSGKPGRGTESTRDVGASSDTPTKRKRAQQDWK